MLKNIISVLTAHYDLALNEEFGLPNPSVDEDKVAEEVLNTQDRHTNMVPPKSIQVQWSTIAPLLGTEPTERSQDP